MTRAEQVAHNDDALRNAAATVIFESGWDDLSFSAVAKHAGLTVGAVYGRAENTAELGIDLWESRVAPWLNASVTSLLAAAEAGSAAELASLLGAWQSDPTAAVAVEMLIAALFDVDLADGISTSAREVLGSRATVRRSGSNQRTAHQAAAGALVTAFALGRAVGARTRVSLPTLTTEQAEVLARYYAAEPSSGTTPRGRPLTWLRAPTDDLATDRTLPQATLRVVGRVGYRRATISRIAREAGIPRGSVLSHYADKASLISTAAADALIPPVEVWQQYAAEVAEFGPLVSRAMFLAEFLKPANRDSWALNLELARVSRRIPELARYGAGETILEQTHLGVMLLACYVPGLVKLPYLGPFTAGSAT